MTDADDHEGLSMHDNFRITHTGLFCGFIPVYLDMSDEEEPGIMTRHWIFDPIMDGIGWLFAAADRAAPILITGEIHGAH